MNRDWVSSMSADPVSGVFSVSTDSSGRLGGDRGKPLAMDWRECCSWDIAGVLVGEGIEADDLDSNIASSSHMP